MVPEIESFGHLMIARRAGGEPVELVRSPDEVVFLAFDTSIRRLVELHVLRSGRTLDSEAKMSAFERANQASEIRGPSFMRILDVGEDQGLVYYTSNLNDGEFIGDYVQRRGPLMAATVFSLVFQLLDDLILLRGYRRLISQMRLDRVVVTTLEDTFLQLRVFDYGLSAPEQVTESDSGLVIQACELMFLMLTGKSFGGDNPDRYPALTALPMSLRTTLRVALTDPSNAPASIEKLRDDVREAFSALVSSIQARNSRRQLVVTPALQPQSQLQNLLLENVPIESILGNRFHVEGGEDARRYPFSIPCLNAKTEHPVTVHLLPPARIVEKSQYEAVPLQMWRFNADKHPNILRSLSLWESPDWTFLTEEREPGFTLSRLLAERIALNPAEVAVLLRQVKAGLEQALECGVQRLDLHPSNIFLRVGKAGPLLSREYERLMQKRLDAWPPFLVKLRAHLTMRNLYEAPLTDLPEHGEHPEEHIADRDYRSRALVSFAAYLLTGARQSGTQLTFPESVTDPLADYMRECLEFSRHQGRTPNPQDFVSQFESLMSVTTTGPDLATRLRGTTIPIEEMESAGSISDFDNEWASSTDEEEEPVTPISRKLKPHDFSRRSSASGLSWPVWAAAAVTVIGLFSWWLFSGEKPAPAPTTDPLPSATAAAELPQTAAPQIADKVSTPIKATPPEEKKIVAQESMPSPAVAATSPAPRVEAPAPVVATPPAPKPIVVTAPPSVTPAPAPEPIPTPVVAPAPQPPPAPVTVPNPVIIRKAIVPSPEEIAKFKQGLIKPKNDPQPVEAPAPAAPPAPPKEGRVPVINVAEPMPPSSAAVQ